MEKISEGELGEGWDKIIKEHQEHPLNPEMPKIDSSRHSTTVTLFSTQDKFKKGGRLLINDRQKKALEYVEKHERITNREYRGVFPEITSRTVLNDLNDLADKKLLWKRGETKGTYYIIPK